MIGTLKDFPDNVIALSCAGQVTKEDYDRTLGPAILEALKRHDKIRLLFAEKVLSALRYQFGGHDEKAAADKAGA